MKRMQFLPTILICLSGIFSLASCSNNDTVAPAPSVIVDNAQSGTWRITSFIDSGKDETSHFSGFTFTFDDNGKLTSTNGSVSYTGTWGVTNSNSGDDSPGNQDFHILFNLSNDFKDLSEDWQIVSQSSGRIELIHVSGGNGGTDYLTFEKV